MTVLPTSLGRIAVVLNLLTYVLIRWPHGNRWKTVTVADDRQGRLEFALLVGATLGTTMIPLTWVVLAFPSFANYPLHPIAFGTGVVFAVLGNWVFYRTHADLGLNWSVTLQLRDGHELVTNGIYRRIRHPMYLAMFLQGIGQALFLPNWIAGPAWLMSFGLLYLLRVGKEERMMQDQFGDEYTAYMKQSGRLLPPLKKPDDQ